MTKKQARILIGTTIAFLIIGAGLFTGWFFSTHKIVSVEEKTERAVQKAEPNFNTYDVSPPSRATVLETYDLVIDGGGATISVPVPKKEAGAIKTGQRVLLYDAQGVALETLGAVKTVELGKDQPDSVMVTIEVQHDVRIDLTQARRASIVIRRIPAAPRLPLSALIQDDKGESFVWEAVQGRDGVSTAYLQKIYVASVTKEFFVLGEGSRRGSLYILHPDDALREGQKINTKNILYQGPPQTEDSRIEVLMEDRRLERMEDLNLWNKQNAGAAPGTNMSAACNAQSTSVQSFISSIKSNAAAPKLNGPASPPLVR